jgi:hypothetical protein
MAYRCVAVSLQAEENLHATLFTIRLVEQFVAENGRWPHSWDELEKLSVPGYDWPAASTDIQRRVVIDFGADLKEIAQSRGVSRQSSQSARTMNTVTTSLRYRPLYEKRSGKCRGNSTDRT